MKLYDITVPVSPAMAVWPGDAAPRRELAASIADGAVCNISVLTLCVHTGTHIDAPYHFEADGRRIHELDPAVLVGPAQVIEVAHDGDATAQDLGAAGIRPDTRRVLIKTRNSRRLLMRAAEFDRGFAAVAPDAAAWLVEHGIALVGVDYLSVEAFAAPGHPTHHTLLGAGVVALEGCDLSEVPVGDYTLFCGAMLLEGADGAPARAMLLIGPGSQVG